MKFIDKNKFTKIALNKNFEILIIYITTLELLAEILVYLLQIAQIATL